MRKSTVSALWILDQSQPRIFIGLETVFRRKPSLMAELSEDRSIARSMIGYWHHNVIMFFSVSSNFSCLAFVFTAFIYTRLLCSLIKLSLSLSLLSVTLCIAAKR